jgi:hypothetical protein
VENLNEISAVGPDRFALALEMLPLHDPQVGSPIFSEVSSIYITAKLRLIPSLGPRVTSPSRP